MDKRIWITIRMSIEYPDLIPAPPAVIGHWMNYDKLTILSDCGRSRGRRWFAWRIFLLLSVSSDLSWRGSRTVPLHWRAPGPGTGTFCSRTRRTETTRSGARSTSWWRSPSPPSAAQTRWASPCWWSWWPPSSPARSVSRASPNLEFQIDILNT